MMAQLYGALPGGGRWGSSNHGMCSPTLWDDDGGDAMEKALETQLKNVEANAR